MKNAIKKGFGLTIGAMLGYATLATIAVEVLKWGAKDEQYMERLKNRDPELYERLKKYVKEEEES